MNRMIKSLIALVLGLGVTVSAQADLDWTTSGSYSVGKTAQYTISEEGEVYLKLSGLKAGSAYTFLANGSGASVSVVYTYKDEEGDLYDDWLASSTPDVKTPDQDRCIVTADDWIGASIVKDPEWEYEKGEWAEEKVSPKGYYLYVSGEGGATITVSSMSGAVEEPIPLGDVENPKAIAPGTMPATVTADYVDGAYYFTIGKAKVGKYLLSTQGGTLETPVTVAVDADNTATFTTTDVSTRVATDGNMAYLLDVTAPGTLNFHVAGNGTSFGLTHRYAKSGTLGTLTVRTKGTAGKWYIKGVTGTKYASGDSIGILGAQTVCFDKVTKFSTPTNMVAVPTEAEPSVEFVGVYNDTFDPKDDAVSGKSGSVTCAPTKLTVSSKVATALRTLFVEDKADYFQFTAKAGVYYNFALSADTEEALGDAVMTIAAKAAPDTVLVGPATKFAKWSPAAGDYYLKVAHAGTGTDAQYALAYSSVNVGTLSFAKTAVSAKKSAGTVSLTVSRSSAEGKVRVKYGTVNGSAQPGVDYVAQNGELVWENDDKKAKTITIKLIPEAFAEEAISRQFSVRLEAVADNDLAEDEYPAVFADGKDVAVVTVTEAKGKAASAVKAATVKTEAVPLETGTYQGVIAEDEDGSALTNGFPALASVTFTAKDATKKALSAKVALGGKTYSFAADTWDADESDATTAVAVMTLKQTVNKVAYENTLRIAVARGATATAGDWEKALASVQLTMNVPDANGKGVQEKIVYAGDLYRDNAKVQDYLYAVTNAVGYYTVALAPSGVLPGDGIPAGNGYLTLTIDNKGKAKIAGMLADGTTKPSYSSIVAVQDDGDTLLVPVFVAKSPYCFGGTLRLVRSVDGQYVVDSSVPLLWNNDNALLTYDGEAGWRIMLVPVGGYFNTVDNLQAHYLTCALSVSTLKASDLLAEGLASGYGYVDGIGPNELAVSLVGNTLSTEKKALVKDGKLVDFEQSVNPCNVQVKLTRATGLVTGSFSVWTENAEGAQKEITGLKHNGILILARAENAPIDSDILTAGFFTQTATLTYYNEKNQKKTRKYTASNPFNILAVDQGEPDWYADDWGERPE